MRVSTEESIKRVQKAKELIATGMPKYKAIEEAHTTQDSFNKYANGLKTRKPYTKRAKFIDLEPARTISKVMIIVCEPGQIGQVIKGAL